MSINLVSLIGHLGRDPELHTFESGSCTAEFTLALKRQGKESQPVEPVWVRCKAWNQTARLAADHLRKGSKVGLLGRLDNEEWTDRRSGDKRSRTVVVITRLELLDRPRQSNDVEGSAEGSAGQGLAPMQQTSGGDGGAGSASRAAGRSRTQADGFSELPF